MSDPDMTDAHTAETESAESAKIVSLDHFRKNSDAET